METVNGLENLKPKKDCAVTIGTFDGIHPGHLKIIDTLLNVAKKNELCSTLVTFEPHPKLVVNSAIKNSIRLLTTIDEKIKYLQETKLDRTVVINFDKSFSNQSYETFVKNILIDKIGAKAIIVGYDHAFGKNREGNFENLQTLSKKYGFLLQRVDSVQIENKIISSTLLRNIIKDGNVGLSSEYLGRNYSLIGTVVPGNARGKKLNFPTANLKTGNSDKLIPKEGVYAVDIEYNGQTFKGMLNIGNQPTFGIDGNYSSK